MPTSRPVLPITTNLAPVSGPPAEPVPGNFLNAALVRAISTLRNTAGDAELTISDGLTTRALYVRKGELVGGSSTDSKERIGAMVARAKNLAPELIEVIARTAAEKGKLLGDTLIAEGLVSPSELMGLLEEQTVTRFNRALTLPGEVSQKPLSAARGVLRRPLGALFLAAFRDKLPAGVVDALCLFIPGSAYRVVATDAELTELGVSPAESRVLRRLAQGESLSQLLMGPGADATLRFVLALIALDVLRAKS